MNAPRYPPRVVGPIFLLRLIPNLRYKFELRLFVDFFLLDVDVVGSLYDSELTVRNDNKDMYSLHLSPAPHVLNGSHIHNINIPHSTQFPRPKHLGQHPRFTLSSKKASATVSLTNANANVSCVTTNFPSLVSNSVSLSCPSFSESRSQNVIPFPSVPIDIEFPGKTTTTTTVGESSSRHSHIRPIPRRRRSQAPLPHPSQSQLHSCSPQIASPKSRKHTSSSQISPARPKRARKTRRFLGDLQFCAIVHRSIVWRMRTLGVHARISEEGYHEMDIDGCADATDRRRERERAELLQQDGLLVKRLWCSLMEHGCQPVLLEDVVSLSPSVATCKGPGMLMAGPLLSCESSMDIDVDAVSCTRTPFSSPSPSPTRPSSPTFSISSPSPSSPPTPFPSATTKSPAEVLSMPQLVATLILRHRERNAVRVRACASPRFVSGCGSSEPRGEGKTRAGQNISCRSAEGSADNRVGKSPLSMGITFITALAASQIQDP